MGIAKTIYISFNSTSVLKEDKIIRKTQVNILCTKCCITSMLIYHGFQLLNVVQYDWDGTSSRGSGVGSPRSRLSRPSTAAITGHRVVRTKTFTPFLGVADQGQCHGGAERNTTCRKHLACDLATSSLVLFFSTLNRRSVNVCKSPLFNRF